MKILECYKNIAFIFTASLFALISCTPIQVFENQTAKARIVFERKKRVFIDSLDKAYKNKIISQEKKILSTEKKAESADSLSSELRDQISQMELSYKSYILKNELEKEKKKNEETLLNEQIKTLKTKNATCNKEIKKLSRNIREVRDSVLAPFLKNGKNVQITKGKIIASNPSGSTNCDSVSIILKEKNSEILHLKDAINEKVGVNLPFAKNKIYYKIQAATISKDGFTEKAIDGMGEIIIVADKILKFEFGMYEKYEDAVEGRKILLSLGFKRSWIVKYKNGIRIN